VVAQLLLLLLDGGQPLFDLGELVLDLGVEAV
jgi:hypothetical protein